MKFVQVTDVEHSSQALPLHTISEDSGTYAHISTILDACAMISELTQSIFVMQQRVHYHKIYFKPIACINRLEDFMNHTTSTDCTPEQYVRVGYKVQR
ncbi:unnamed protein product [Arctia plantaginis]|uniref:Uncharacterized protein n=1 Tax=Arctia plantaginis TaxID=874455 RepID=A0A8S1A5Y4_ARCPL|nr:unnamed protein product [Arctia plantaginis]